MNNLAEHLKETGVLKTPSIIKAFEQIDRKDFVLPEMRKFAYADEPLTIGFQQTISQPYTVAFMLELLQPRRGMRILDVGSGSGWQTALLAKIAGRTGSVVALERIKDLLEQSRSRLEKYNITNVKFVYGNAWENQKFPQQFDRIAVAAASPYIPTSLLALLKNGGRMVLPIGVFMGQDLVLVQKNSQGTITEKRYPGFAFVPLVKEE